MDKPKKRIFAFESLEERELLSVSPLLYGVHSFVDNTPAYVAPSSSVSKTAPALSAAADLVTLNNPYADFLEDRNLAADLSDTDWHNVSTMSAEGEEECAFGGTVSVSTETSEVEERMRTGIVTITRTDDMPGYSPQLTAKFSLTGTATPGVDYSAAGLTYNSTNESYEGEIVLYAGETSAGIGIINDAIQKSSETVIFTLLSVNNVEYEITSNSATVTIIDDDDWTITGSGGDLVWERDSSDPPSFEIIRSGGLDRTYGITTEFAVSGNAAPGVDFGLAWSYGNDPETAISLSQNNGVWKGSVYFPANTTDDTINVYVIPINDALPEDNETITLSVTNAYANPLHPFTANGNGTTTIQDDDDWTVTGSVTDGIALEPCVWIPGNERTGTFELTKSGGLDNSYGIMIEFELGGTATPVADYGLSWYGSGDSETMISIIQVGNIWKGSVYFQASDDAMDLFVVPCGDHIFENDEIVTITIIDAYAVYGYSFNYSGTSGDVTIYQAPEFISDTDKNVDTDTRPFATNQDIYNIPFQYGKPDVGTTVIDTLTSAYNRPVQYSIVSGNDDDLYEIDADSGRISFKEIPNFSYEGGNLHIKVADSQYPGLYDTAAVTFTFGWANFVMCVRQPVFNSRTIYVMNNNVPDMGHTYWRIEASKGLMNSGLISSNLTGFANNSWGYWPNITLGMPGSSGYTISAQGVLQNDNGKTTNVYKRYGINSFDNFLSLLQFTKSTMDVPGTFHAFTHNCTTVAIAAADSAGVDVPKTLKHVDFNYGGQDFDYDCYNPADMGQDLRQSGGISGQFFPYFFL